MTETALELNLAPEAATRLFRHPAIAARSRSQACAFTLYTSAEGALSEAGLAVIVRPRRRGAVQQLVRTMPEEDGPWLPGAPMPVLAETAIEGEGPDRATPDLDALAEAHGLGDGLVPQGLAAFAGRISRAAAGEGDGPAVTLLAGTLRAIWAERAIARVTLTGTHRSVFRLAAALASDLPLSVPVTSVGEEARALAQGTTPRPLRLGAPAIPRDATVAEAFSAIVSHLTLAMLANAPAAHLGETPEGTHQTRVALRRLRSALTLFRDMTGPAGEEAAAGLKALAKRLAPARDWDVFIGGRLAEVAAAFAGDERIATLGAAARARREEAYAALRLALDAPGFRLLGLSLAALAHAPPEAPEPVQRFAARALSRRLKRVLRHGEDLSPLPVAELHRIRLEAKRLRYAGEMFAPLFGRKRARRYLSALAEVQEALGHLNDIAVASALLAAITPEGEKGAFAAGVVEGWIAAKADGAREDAALAWERFLDRDPFWQA
jgi:CHAD domain-containing protein